MSKFTFDNRLLVGIEIKGEFLERRRHEAEGINESKSHLTAGVMLVEETYRSMVSGSKSMRPSTQVEICLMMS